MREIEKFIKKLKDWQNNFEVKNYEFEKYDCEIAQITKSLQECDATSIAEILKSKISQNYFEIKHPLKNDILLRAVFNINICDIHPCNAIFFVDKDNKNLICVIQWFVFIHYFITETDVFICHKSWGDPMGDSVKLLAKAFEKRNFKESVFRFQDKKWAWTLYHNRPAHYFFHIFPNYYAHLTAKETSRKCAFFLPKVGNFICNCEEDKEFVYLYPFTHYSQEYNNTIFSQMLIECLQDFNTLIPPNDIEDKFDKEEVSESEITSLVTSLERQNL